MNPLSRRDLLASAAAAVSLALKTEKAHAQQTANFDIPIIDTHIHLFDQTRPQGAPYSGNAGNTQPALPETYRTVAPQGIVGAIEVEASSWVEDNLWVLEVEARDTMMVGTVGNLQPDKPEFPEYLERYHRNKLFLGIRYGNLWGYDLTQQMGNPAFVNGLKLLQQADLVLDTANPNPLLLKGILRASDAVPELRIVIDHVPAMLRQLSASDRASIEPDMRDLAARPNVYIKVSEVLVVSNGLPILDPAAYKTNLDYLFDTFGENKLIFGSDWPNSVAADNLGAVLQIVRNYFYAKGSSVAEKYFWRNSIPVYKWVRREYAQPTL